MAVPDRPFAISVSDASQKPLDDVWITLTPIDGAAPRAFTTHLDQMRRGRFWPGDQPPEGRYLLRIEATGKAPQEREVTVGRYGLEAAFVLGVPSAPTYRSGAVEVPIEVAPERLGLRLATDVDAAVLRQIEDATGGTVEPSPGADDGYFSLQLPKGTPDADRQRAIEALRDMDEVETAGRLLIEQETAFAVSTGELSVQFARLSEDEIALLASELGIELVELIDRQTCMYVVRPLGGPMDDDAIGLSERLLQHPDVLEAEPLVAARRERRNAIPPADVLFADQWDRPLTALANAWTHMRARNPVGVAPGDAGDITFGSPNICIMVYDHGIESVTDPAGNVVARCPDYAGTVSDGRPKMADFLRMNVNPYRRDNHVVLSDHGINCAGASSALGNNRPSAGLAVHGTVGNAPNTRLIGMIEGNVAIAEVRGWLWAAGLPQPAPVAALPAPLPQQPADVFSVSVGIPGAQMYRPLMRRLTECGRGGRGVVVCFAAGNGNQSIQSILEGGVIDWLTRTDTTITVTATTLSNTLDEIRAPYSNFGPEADLCAPAHSRFVGINHIVHDPPGLWAITATDLFGRGQLPGAPGSMTVSLTQAAGAGATQLYVADTSGLVDGMVLVFGQPGDAHHHARTIQTVNAATFLTLTAGLTVAVPVNAVASGVTNLHLAVRLAAAFDPMTAPDRRVLTLASVVGFEAGQRVLIGRPGDANSEIREIAAVDPGTHRLHFTAALALPHAAASAAHQVYVFGGAAATTLRGPVAAGIRNLPVASSARFHIGQAVFLGVPRGSVAPYAEGARITAIPDGQSIRISRNTRQAHAGGVPAFGGRPDYADDFGGTSHSCPQVAGTAALMLSVNPHLSWLEVRQILRDTADKILQGFRALPRGVWEDDMGRDIIDAGTGVAVPGVGAAHFSEAFGYGRLNVQSAITAAAAYTHDERDLMIRNHMGDDGRTRVNPATHPIQSPDIWVRNTAPAADAAAAWPAGYVNTTAAANRASYDAIAPHHDPTPNAATNRHIYARIRNRGTAHEGLHAKARFFMIRTANGAPFALPADWCNPRPMADMPTGDAGFFHFHGAANLDDDDRPLHDTPADGPLPAMRPSGADPAVGVDRPVRQARGGIPPGENFIVRQQWNAANLPPAGQPLANRLRTFLLVEISPHDGIVRDGAGRAFDGPARLVAGQNNNFSTREVVFASIALAQSNGGPALADVVAVGQAGTGEVAWHASLAEPIGYFRTGDLEAQVDRIAPDGTVETTTHAFDAGTNAWQATPAAAWSNFAPPTLPNAANPTAREHTTELSGTFRVTNAHNRARISVRLRNDQGAVLTEVVHELHVLTVPVFQNPRDLIASGRPGVHLFADLAAVGQQAEADAFGPDPADRQNRFRVTAKLPPANVANPVAALAAVTGHVLVQRVANDPHRVNVILKPLRQPRIGFTRVRYFVYRGLELTDFLKGPSAADSQLVRDRAGAEPFIVAIHEAHHARRTAEEAAKGNPAPPPENPPAEAFGLRAGQNDGDRLAALFYSDAGTSQLPLVRIGHALGTFWTPDAADRIGFEIVLEDARQDFTLAFARQAETVIDVTGVAGAPDRQRAAEACLDFVDPAAYLGMHFDLGVENADNANPILKGAELYQAAVAKFFTRNTQYLDIRNEHGYSLNYARNYAVGADQVRVGATVAALAATPYADYGTWPLLIRRNLGAVSGDAVLPTQISLAAGDNPRPLLYAEWGEVQSTSIGDDVVTGADLEGDPWTLPVAFVSRAVPDVADATRRLAVAEHLKLHYFRREPLNPVANPGAGVVQALGPTGTLFGPLGIGELFSTGNQEISWLAAKGLRLFDGDRISAVDATRHVARRGVALEIGAVVYYAAATRMVEPAGSQRLPGIAGGTSARGSFLDVAYLFRGLDATSTAVTVETGAGNATQAANLFKLVPPPGGAVKAEAFLALGLTEAENALLAAVAGFGDAHERTLMLEDEGGQGDSAFTDPSGTRYFRYRVRVQGWDPAGTYRIADPGQPVRVFSLDRLTYGSLEFFARPLPGGSFTPSLEEGRAARFADTLVPTFAQPRYATVEDLVNGFNALLTGLPQNAQLKLRLTDLAQAQGEELWRRARDRARDPALGAGAHDDRTLYWGRLVMNVALQRHAARFLSPGDATEIGALFDRISRGYFEADFRSAANGGPVQPGDKRVLVLGLDPYVTDTTPERRNIGAALAMAVDEQRIAGNTATALIHGAVLPRRYREYGLLVERYIDFYLEGNPPIDAVLTVGQHIPGKTSFDIDRLGVHRRGDLPDNEGRKPKYLDMLKVSGFKDYIAGNLPFDPALLTAGANPRWVHDQSYGGAALPAGSPLRRHPREAGGHASQQAALYDDTALSGTPEFGGAGNFFENELFYRCLRFRELYGNRTAMGHITLPDPADSGLTPEATVDAGIAFVRSVIDRL